MKELRELRKELSAAIKAGYGRVGDRLFDLLEKQSKRCERLEKENRRLTQRIAELEKQDPPAAKSTPSESYSLEAQEKRRRRKQRQRQTSAKTRKPGRKPNKDKLECVARWIDILPVGKTVARVSLGPQSELDEQDRRGLAPPNAHRQRPRITPSLTRQFHNPHNRRPSVNYHASHPQHVPANRPASPPHRRHIKSLNQAKRSAKRRCRIGAYGGSCLSCRNDGHRSLRHDLVTSRITASCLNDPAINI